MKVMANNLTKIGFWLALAPLLALYIALAMPFVGIIAFDYLAHDSLAACERTSEGIVKTCLINGVDAGVVFGYYIMSVFVAGIANPLIAFFAIPVIVPWYILLFWICTIVILWFAQRLSKREA